MWLYQREDRSGKQGKRETLKLAVNPIFPSVCMAEGRLSVKRTALRHIDEVVHMIVAELIEEGKPIPEDVSVSRDPLVSVTV